MDIDSKRREGRRGSGKEGKKEKEAIPIRIDCLRIENGSIDFDDMKAGETPGRSD